MTNSLRLKRDISARGYYKWLARRACSWEEQLGWDDIEARSAPHGSGALWGGRGGERGGAG
jgi:hypothetical protein